MDYETIKSMSVFKQLTGGDTIYIEFKGMSGFNYRFKGVLWFICNKLPYFGGDQGAHVYQRIMPIYCNNVIPEDKRDPWLFDKMKEEKNVIIKYALAGLKQLINNKFKFVEPSKITEYRKEYEVQNNTLLSFIKDCCYVKKSDNDYGDEEDGIRKLTVKRSTFKTAYDTYIKINCNNRGKIPYKQMKDILIEHFDENFKLYNGYYYMDKILLEPSAMEELGLYFNGNEKMEE